MIDDFRVGLGVDFHRFAEDRKLILGGVEIPFEKGLEGHSDADVVLHAMADAMLGALSLGDIGFHFPNTDMKWKNVDSLVLLHQVNALIEKEGFTLHNADIMLMMELPKISPYIEEMKNKIAHTLKTETNRISIKATTTEGLGDIGRGTGASAQAVVLLKKNQ